MNELLFYTTSGCHLCEYAEEMLNALGQTQPIRVTPVDISESEALVSRYGLTIPVVRNPRSGQELNWPFEQYQIVELLRTPEVD